MIKRSQIIVRIVRDQNSKNSVVVSFNPISVISAKMTLRIIMNWNRIVVGFWVREQRDEFPSGSRRIDNTITSRSRRLKLELNNYNKEPQRTAEITEEAVKSLRIYKRHTPLYNYLSSSANCWTPGSRPEVSWFIIILWQVFWKQVDELQELLELLFGTKNVASRFSPEIEERWFREIVNVVRWRWRAPVLVPYIVWDLQDSRSSPS